MGVGVGVGDGEGVGVGDGVGGGEGAGGGGGDGGESKFGILETLLLSSFRVKNNIRSCLKL